jgi:hypothetical protein
MKPTLDTRTFTNFMLTAIAVLLAAIALHLYRVDFAQTARAQSGFSATGKSAPLDLSSVPQTQDVAVAAATREVADANRDIAAALRELAKSVESAGSAVGSASSAAATKGGSGSVSGPASGGSMSTSDNKPNIEIR